MLKKRRFLSTLSVIFLVAVMFLSACSSNETSGEASNENGTGKDGTYNAGTYTATAPANNGEIKVDVTFTKDKIEKIEVVEQQETEGLGDVALQKVADEILQSQNLNVDIVSGASVASNAMIDAVAAAVDQAGGDSEALRAVEKEVAKGEDEEISTDIVIVGGGAAGTSAALAAAEKGAKVVVIEKGDTLGGAGRYLAEGLLAFESSQQKEAGYTDTVEEAIQYLNEYTHYLNNGNLTRAVLEQSGETIDWLAKYGVDTKLNENTQKAHTDVPVTYHKYVDKHQGYENMYQHLKEMGGTTYTKTTGKELITDNDGNVIGIIAEKADGGKLTVNAKSVILATGGYAGSAEMIKEHLDVTNYTSMAFANNTGDGINMALDVGADDFNLSTIAIHSALIPTDDPNVSRGSTGQLLNLPLMWVNHEGKRFVDEGIVYDYALMGNALVAQGGEFFVVLDEATMKTLVEEGTDLENSFEKTFLIAAGVDTTTSTGKVAPMKDLYDSMKATIGAGVGYKADTIEELAKTMDVDVDNLKAATVNYNKAVKTGKDPEFLKNSDYLKYGVEKGPFYAVKGAALVEDSIGGLRVNSSLQVLNNGLKPINGLYAVGCDAGGLFGDSYPVYEGLSLSFAFNSGRLAGYSAAEALNK